MGLDEVKQEILNNAKKQAKKIIEDAEKEREIILSQANERIKELKSRIDEETKNNIEQYKTMVFTEVSASIKKQKLNLEKKIIDEVFEKVKEKLNTLPKNKRNEHIKKLISNVEEGYTKVYCSEKDKDLLKDLLTRYDAKVENILGGVILEDKFGEVRIDLSYETLLEEVKKENISDVSKILFK